MVDNPDIASEVALLRSVGPDVPKDKVLQLSVLFAELRASWQMPVSQTILSESGKRFFHILQLFLV